jgi:peptide/nickel transport system substrate-binding protein
MTPDGVRRASGTGGAAQRGPNGHAAFGEGAENTEWELADLVDGIAASIDDAEDTLALKSHARGVSFAIKQLQLDLEVQVRRAADGSVRFRTVDPAGAGATVLRLDFSQMLENQLAALRRPLDQDGVEARLETLEAITEAEVRALNAIAIYSIGDLERYTRTGAMLGEVSRKTGIADPRIRSWRMLPYLVAATPASGGPGTSVVFEGGNLGAVAEPGTLVLFQGQPAAVESWGDSRIVVRMPSVTGTGVVFAIAGGVATNPLPWEAVAADLVVEDVAVRAGRPLAGDRIELAALLRNAGTLASGPFDVRWTVDGVAQPLLPHGSLDLGETSLESSATLALSPAAGRHTVQFEVDPDHKLVLARRAGSVFRKELIVATAAEITLADARALDSLDPLTAAWPGPMDVFGLLFRGLGRVRLADGEVMPDLAASWAIGPADALTVEIGKGAAFHDGAPVTAADVAYSYERARGSAAWRRQLADLASVEELAADRVRLTFRGAIAEPSARLLALPLVPRHLHESDPDGFARMPVGAGPFAVDELRDREMLVLRGFAGDGAAPRLDRITVMLGVPAEELPERLERGELAAARMPFDPAVEQRFADSDGWTAARLPSSEAPAQLDVQSHALLERVANAVDSTWNARLWYTRAELRELMLTDGRRLDGAAVVEGDVLDAVVELAMPCPAAVDVELVASGGVEVPELVRVAAGSRHSDPFAIAIPDAVTSAPTVAARAGASRRSVRPAVVAVSRLTGPDERPLEGIRLPPEGRVEARAEVSIAPSHPVTVELTAGRGLDVPDTATVSEGERRSESFAVAARAKTVGARTVTAGLGSSTTSARVTVAPQAGGVLYAVLVRDLGGGGRSALEMVDVASQSRIGGATPRLATPTSIVAVPGGERLYVLDRGTSALVVLDREGREIAATQVADPRDCAMSRDGTRLFVTAGRSLLSVSADDLSVSTLLATDADSLLGVAVSPVGDIVGAVATQGGGSPGLYLVEAATGKARRIGIENPGEPTNCTTSPNDVVFTDTGQALLWDSNCDNLYQVDVAASRQVPAGTIRMGRDSGSTFNFNGVVHYSVAAQRAYALKESGHLAVMDPVAAAGTLVGDLGGTPFALGLTPDGRTLALISIRRFQGGGPDVLHLYDTVEGTMTRDAYVFSDPDLSVRALVVA